MDDIGNLNPNLPASEPNPTTIVVVPPAAPVTPEHISVPDAPSPEAMAEIAYVKQIADKFPNVDPNIVASIVAEVKAADGLAKEPACCGVMDMPAPLPPKQISMAPAILAGRYSMQEIVENGLGLNYAEFKSDMRVAYSHINGVQATAIDIYAVQNLFRNKYGLNINLPDISACEDDEIYWRAKLAATVEKIEKNQVSVGDEVIITADNCHFGKSGTLMSISGDKAEVLADGVANLPIAVDNPHFNLRLPTGTERKAMLHIGADTHPLHQGDSYPAGISPRAISAWYKTVGASVYSKLTNLEPVTLHKVANANALCVHKSYSGDVNQEVNLENLVAVYARITDITKVAAVSVTPGLGQSDSSTRSVVADLIDEMVTDRTIEDIQVRFSGAKDYYIIVTFAAADAVANQQARLQRMVTTYLQNGEFANYGAGVHKEPNKVVISTTVRTVPAAYSINHTTGLVCVPLDPMKLNGFNHRQATITHLNEVHGLGIEA